MKWLEDVLGCERREDHRDDGGNVVHAELDFAARWCAQLGRSGP